MSVHPFRPAALDERDPLGASRSTGRRDPSPDPTDAVITEPAHDVDAVDDALDDLINGLADTANRFGSFDLEHQLAHRAVTPALLSGLCRLDRELCRAFHAAMFELLEDVGDFDGLIATRDFFVDVGTRRMRAADTWLRDHPAPAERDDSRPGRDAVADHSMALAVAIGSNPSLTFASNAAVRERLLEGVLEMDGDDMVVCDEQIDWLIDLTLRLLSETRLDVITVGGVSVWAAAHPHEF